MRIESAIQKVTGITFEEICSLSRKSNIVDARIMAARLFNEDGQKQECIAKRIKRTHSAVSYFLRIFWDRYDYDRNFREMFDQIKALIN